MELKLGELYKKLAQKLHSMIPCEWTQLYYLGEVEKDRLSCNSVFYFTSPKGNRFSRSYDIPELCNVSESIFDDLLSELNDILLEIYDCFIENDQPPWEQISVNLNSSGKFSIDFNYDVMHKEDGGQSRREVIWAYETFGHMPAEGKYTRQILDKYIKSKSDKPKNV